ncbi:hypothetical protein [Sulfurimonas sp. C5]|uniref:hypothetical protein n=1 Tax=Sulfurimonas sp. C5 TaxID=3036947 RepID=UPI00245674B4|nr:hypothetical protein [Sulfurimonas sp. C5]MDH4943929.1 hypothetical protein [Sulfurimonas sp. C5]
MSERKEKLIQDIQNLLNSYEGGSNTSINPALLEFMDEKTLIGIIDSLLDQKEDSKEADVEWLEQFKITK